MDPRLNFFVFLRPFCPFEGSFVVRRPGVLLFRFSLSHARFLSPRRVRAPSPFLCSLLFSFPTPKTVPFFFFPGTATSSGRSVPPARMSTFLPFPCCTVTLFRFPGSGFLRPSPFLGPGFSWTAGPENDVSLAPLTLFPPPGSRDPSFPVASLWRQRTLSPFIPSRGLSLFSLHSCCFSLSASRPEHLFPERPRRRLFRGDGFPTMSFRGSGCFFFPSVSPPTERGTRPLFFPVTGTQREIPCCVPPSFGRDTEGPAPLNFSFLVDSVLSIFCRDGGSSGKLTRRGC